MNLEQFFRREPIAERGISVILTSCNDAATLEADVLAVTQTLERIGRSHEIIIVDDGSTDATAEIAERLAAANRRVHLIRHDPPRGCGAALRSGVAVAKHPLVWQFDGGGQFDAADIEKLLAQIDRADIVCGSRERVGTWGFGYAVYRWMLRWVFAVHVRDVDCGFRLGRRAALRRIPIQSDGRFAHAEILAKATFMNMLLTEVGIAWRCSTNALIRWRESARRTRREAANVFRRPQFIVREPSGEPSRPTSQNA
jgi:glycosyltransferase involved in cell wall biosynthesis